MSAGLRRPCLQQLDVEGCTKLAGRGIRMLRGLDKARLLRVVGRISDVMSCAACMYSHPHLNCVAALHLTQEDGLPGYASSSWCAGDAERHREEVLPMRALHL